MTLTIDHSPSDFADREDVQSFAIFDGNNCLMLFWWTADDDNTAANFDEVLDALPRRLSEMGHEDEAEKITAEVRRKYSK